MTSEGMYQYLREQYEGVVLKVKELSKYNPEADFSGADEHLKVVRSMLESASEAQVLGRGDDERITIRLRSARTIAQVASTTNMQRRFEEAAELVKLSRVCIERVVARATSLVEDRNHGKARRIYIDSIARITWARGSTDVAEEAIDALLATDKGKQKSVDVLENLESWTPPVEFRRRVDYNPYASTVDDDNP